MAGLKTLARRLTVAMILVSSGLLYAQGDLATREASQRATATKEAHALLEKGDKAYRSGDFSAAVKDYGAALGLLPRQAEQSNELREAAVARFSQASVEQARMLARRGDYAAANQLLDEVDAQHVAPDSKEVAQMRDQLNDPIRNNPALTKEHSANVDQVRRFLYEAHGFMDLGQFDRAQMTFEDVLRIDRYNKAARRGLERVQWYRSDYSKAAYDHNRAKMLQEVDAAWEDPSYAEAFDIPLIDDAIDGNEILISAPLLKLRSINVPVLDLADASLEEALDYLRSLSVEHDKTEIEGVPKGVAFILQLGSEDHPVVQGIRRLRVNLQVENVPLEHALKLVTEATKTQYRIDEFAIVIRPLGATDETIIRREFRVPPDFLSRGSIGGEQEGNNDDPFANDGDQGSILLTKRFTALEKLKSMGVLFPDGAGASFNVNSSKLIVRNTPANLELVAQLVSTINNTEPVAVIVRTSVIEITQENLEELGYDTILNSIQTGGDLFLSGGTVGSGSSLADMIPGNPVTSGNRSGSEAIIVDGLDTLLTRPAPVAPSGRITSVTPGMPSTGAPENRAPGALSVRGVIDGNLHEVLLRGFSQKKGVDLMNRLEVVTRSGQNAVVRSVTEIRYPDEYEPPELPNSFGTGNGGNTIVTPSTPTTFLETELGVILEVVPTVSADRKLVEVSVRPRIRDLLGFVNFGVPIVGTAGATPAAAASVGEITPNAILKPLIRNIEANTTVTIADGHSIVIGGLMTENVQNFNDGTPILKNLPLVGRYFRSEGLSTVKKNLIIMVQVELVDPSGKPYRNR